MEVTNCFAVPHAERGEEVAIGKDFNKQMLALYNRTNRKEVVVGWYASAIAPTTTTSEKGAEGGSAGTATNNKNGNHLIMDTSSLIHEFYAGETDEGDPIHLVVDTQLQSDSISLRAFRSTPVIVQGEPLANMFHELRLSVQSNEPETICLHQMIAAGNQGNNTTNIEKQEQEMDVTAPSAPETLALQVSMEKLYGLLESTLQYVDSVVDGKIKPDPEVGRQIADTLASVPRVRPEVFDQLFNDSLQDLLMVTYLSNITRTQLTIAEKLNATLDVV